MSRNRHSRSDVREQRERHIERWRKIILNVWGYRPSDRTRYSMFGESHQDFDRYVTEMAAIRQGTRVPCSCCACGNPRRHFGAPYRGEHDDWGDRDID